MNGLYNNNSLVNNSGLVDGLINGMNDNYISKNNGFINNELVLYLDADDKNSIRDSTTTWFDLSGKGNNGTFTNGPFYSPFMGGSINFDGVNDYVSIANTTDLNFGSGDFTIEFWLYPKIPIPGGTLLSINANASYYAALRCQLDETAGPGFLTSTTGTSWVTYSTFTGSTNSRWNRGTFNHLVFTRRGENIFIYVNGSISNIYTPSGGTIGSLMSFSGSTVNRLGHISGSINSYYSGIISLLRIYKTSLTPSQILINYNLSKNRYFK